MAEAGPKRTVRKPKAKAPGKLQKALEDAAVAADAELVAGRELDQVLIALEAASLWAGRAGDK